MAAIVEALTYEDLLRIHTPAVIKSKEDNAKALTAMSDLLSRGEECLSPDERRFVELLATLISDYEKKAYQLKEATPAEVLRELMRARGMKPKDLFPVFGSKGIISEVLRGKRAISKDRAKALAQMFCVSVELFI